MPSESTPASMQEGIVRGEGLGVAGVGVGGYGLQGCLAHKKQRPPRTLP